MQSWSSSRSVFNSHELNVHSFRSEHPSNKHPKPITQHSNLPKNPPRIKIQIPARLPPKNPIKTHSAPNPRQGLIIISLKTIKIKINDKFQHIRLFNNPRNGLFQFTINFKSKCSNLR